MKAISLMKLYKMKIYIPSIYLWKYKNNSSYQLSHVWYGMKYIE